MSYGSWNTRIPGRRLKLCWNCGGSLPNAAQRDTPNIANMLRKVSGASLKQPKSPLNLHPLLEESAYARRPTSPKWCGLYDKAQEFDIK